MYIEIRQESAAALSDYAAVPIAFEVRERLVVVASNSGLGGLSLVAEPISEPWVKDYDAVPGQGPAGWAARFDVARWGIFSAWAGAERAGGLLERPC